MGNLSIYNITNAFAKLNDMEELDTETEKQIKQELQVLLEQKSANIIAYAKNRESHITAIKEEEKRLASYRKTEEAKLERFLAYLKQCMEEAGILKIETPLGVISIAKNPISVEVLDVTKVPKEYKNIEEVIKVDKKAIADNFKETGEVLDGTRIITNRTSLRIK